MKRKQYETPDVLATLLSLVDVITTSDEIEGDWGEWE